MLGCCPPWRLRGLSLASPGPHVVPCVGLSGRGQVCRRPCGLLSASPPSGPPPVHQQLLGRPAPGPQRRVTGREQPVAGSGEHGAGAWPREAWSSGGSRVFLWVPPACAQLRVALVASVPGSPSVEWANARPASLGLRETWGRRQGRDPPIDWHLRNVGKRKSPSQSWKFCLVSRLPGPTALAWRLNLPGTSTRGSQAGRGLHLGTPPCTRCPCTWPGRSWRGGRAPRAAWDRSSCPGATQDAGRRCTCLRSARETWGAELVRGFGFVCL